MSKPSMFSKNYKQELKKRRTRRILLIIVPVIGLAIFLMTDFNALINTGISMKKGIYDIILNKPKDKKSSAVNVEKTPQAVTTQSDAQKSKALQVQKDLKEKAALKNQIFVATLSDGQKINIEYSIAGTEKKIKAVTGGENISYDISPSKKSIVIQSKSNQDLLYIDANKISKDITKKTHESTKGAIYSKEQLLKGNKAYSWSIMPKFIDEDNIAYISELPWMNEKAVKYIWKINLKTNTHSQVKPASGNNIIFKTITSKGLETLVDGNAVYVTSTGGVIN